MRALEAELDASRRRAPLLARPQEAEAEAARQRCVAAEWAAEEARAAAAAGEEAVSKVQVRGGVGGKRGVVTGRDAKAAET